MTEGEPYDLPASTALLLHAVWSTIEVPLVVVDGSARILMANPAAQGQLALAGTGPGDAVRPIRPGIRHSDGRSMREDSRPLRRALAGETVREEEIVLPVRGGGAQRLAVSAHPFLGSDGRRLALMSWRDVTSSWEREESRRATVDQLTCLLDGAEDYAILMLDPRGLVLTWSASAVRLKRYQERQILGEGYEVFFTAADREAGVPGRILDEAAAEGRAVTQGERVRGDGTTFWARGVVTARRHPDGRLAGFVKVTHDVTEEHLAREEAARLNVELRELNRGLEQRVAERTEALQRQASELRAANAELDAFSYSVSHDLRAPLRTMGGFARLIAEDHFDGLDAEARRHLERIQDSAVQMTGLIDGLLELSRVHRHVLAVGRLDMTDVARAAWDAVAPGDVGTSFDLQDLPSCLGDRPLVLQVWVNLLENAVKFTRRTPQPSITVSAAVDDGQPSYVVTDNGAGFDQRHAAKLFVPFQRLHRQEDFPGSGIGLALVRRIVLRHGGWIEAAGSTGAGASFRFALEGGAPR